MFAGMVSSAIQIRLLLGLPAELNADQIPARARDCAARFMRAYAPDPEPHPD